MSIFLTTLLISVYGASPRNTGMSVPTGEASRQPISSRTRVAGACLSVCPTLTSWSQLVGYGECSRSRRQLQRNHGGGRV